MKDYLLFVDTETSDIPKNWKAPCSDGSQWPYIVQLAWVVYTKEGNLVKEENFYIKDDDFEISRASQEVHGISTEYRIARGHNRLNVMQGLQEDLLNYKPLLIAHYVKLDFHMLSVEFFRTQLDNPLNELPAFCTMKATENYIRYPNRRYLSLGELYKRLFEQPLPQPHNALTDAQATAECFFAMVEKRDISEEMLEKQNPTESCPEQKTNRLTYIFIILAILFFVLLIFLQR